MNTEDEHSELPFWIEALGYLCPDQINTLVGLAEQYGVSIAELIDDAIWEKLDADGLLDFYRQAHGLPQDWPFGDQYQQEEDDEA